MTKHKIKIDTGEIDTCQEDFDNATTLKEYLATNLYKGFKPEPRFCSLRFESASCIAEMLSCLLDNKFIEETPEGFRWLDTQEFLGDRQSRKPKTRRVCPECGSDEEHPIRTPKGPLGNITCDMVYGRRGWRQLGTYDG